MQFVTPAELVKWFSDTTKAPLSDSIFYGFSLLLIDLETAKVNMI